jgi:hypothetical protein
MRAYTNKGGQVSKDDLYKRVSLFNILSLEESIILKLI